MLKRLQSMNLLQHLKEKEAALVIKTLVKALIFILTPKDPHPLRPPRRHTYSQSSGRVISSNIEFQAPKGYMRAVLNGKKSGYQTDKNGNLLKPPLPSRRKSSKKKKNPSPLKLTAKLKIQDNLHLYQIL